MTPFLVRLKALRATESAPHTMATKGFMLAVRDFKEASEVCEQFITENKVYFENWKGGYVVDVDGNHIGTVAFNGRVFAPSGKEIV